MRRGAWHQMAHNAQLLIAEQLENGVGSGVIISPRYLKFDLAKKHAQKYRELQAEVLLDPEWYVPNSSIGQLATYPCFENRQSVNSLQKLSQHHLDRISNNLQTELEECFATSVVAPAVPYEAARPEIDIINRQLFFAAKRVGDSLGLPTLATVVLGRSITDPDLVSSALSSPTSLPADGWYFQFEFENSRIPSDSDELLRYFSAGLTLACTDKPALHVSAGPMCMLAFASGATGAAVTFQQNLRGFERSKWEAPADAGGGPGAARFFSNPLWGTIVQPDEVVLLSDDLRAEILEHSPYSDPVKLSPASTWDIWSAKKHIVHCLGTASDRIANMNSASRSAADAVSMLERSLDLHSKVRQEGIILKDRTDAYQMAWRDIIKQSLIEREEDYLWLEMLGR